MSPYERVPPPPGWLDDDEEIEETQVAGTPAPLHAPAAPPPPPVSPAPPPLEPERRRRGSGLWIALVILLSVGLAVALLWRLSDDEASTAPRDGTVRASVPVVEFGDQDLGRQSVGLSVSVVNEGRVAVEVVDLEIVGDDAGAFDVAEPVGCDDGTSLAAGASCTLVIGFAPTERGAREATLLVELGGRLDPIRVPLRGSGVGEPSVTLETTRLELGEFEVGTKQPRIGTLRLTNSGNAPLRIATAEVKGKASKDFRIAGATDCPLGQRLPPRASCTLAVSFLPEKIGPKAATLVVWHDATGSPSRIDLAGEGVGTSALQVGPSLDFGRLDIGDDSAPRKVTVRNTGSAPSRLLSILLTGASSGDFRLGAGTCAAGTVLEAGATCSLAVVFAPTAPGRRTARLSVALEDVEAAGSVQLAGLGREPPVPLPEPDPEGIVPDRLPDEPAVTESSTEILPG